MEQQLIRVHPEACRLLGGISRSKAYELIATGELRSVKIGRRRLIPISAIRDYVEHLEQSQR